MRLRNLLTGLVILLGTRGVALADFVQGGITPILRPDDLAFSLDSIFEIAWTFFDLVI